MERMSDVFQSGHNRKNGRIRCAVNQGGTIMKKTTAAALAVILFASLLSCTRTGKNSQENSLHGEIEQTATEVADEMGHEDQGSLTDEPQQISPLRVTENAEPDTAGTFLNRGILFAVRREFRPAIQEFDQAIWLNPNLANAYILRGRALVASVSDIISIADNFADVVYNIGTVTDEQSRVFRRAMDDFTQAIRIDPNSAVAYSWRGEVYLNLGGGNLDLAIADLNQAIRLDPDYAPAYHNRGNAYFHRESYDLAIADYDKAIRLDPNYAITHISRGAVYLERENYDLAIADYTQAIRLDPNDVHAYNNRGLVHFERGNLDLAIADLTQVIRIDPNNAIAFENRGIAYDERGGPRPCDCRPHPGDRA